MLRIAFGVFTILHGLVHVLYLGQSARYFELQPGMIWPDTSWAFSRWLGDEAARKLASMLLALADVGFAVGGAGILFRQVWWHPLTVVAAALSTAIYVLFWDGEWFKLHDKGAIGVLINIAITVALLVFRWPAFDF